MNSAQKLDKLNEKYPKYCFETDMCPDRVGAVIACHQLSASPDLAARVVQCIVSGYCEFCGRMTYMIQADRVVDVGTVPVGELGDL